MTTKFTTAIILALLAIAIIGQSGAFGEQLRLGLPTRGAPALPSLDASLALTMDPAEYRMSWVYSFGSEFASSTATTTLINTLADNNFNVVVPEIRKYGDAYYNSAYEPWATDVVAGYDPLADMITKAHARNMEVYGWIVTYRIWPRNRIAPATHIWTKHPEWAMINNYGSNAAGSYYNLDPGVPGVQQYVCDVVKDVVTKYPDLDGFNFDYIRYDAYNWGYNPISKERFKSEYGYYPPTATTDSHWATWSAWKRRQVADFVKKCYLEAIHINPQIKMTVDTIGWMGGNPNTDFTGTRAYSELGQDHKGWMENHIIDLNILMNYKRDWTGLLAPTYRYKGYSFGNQQADHRLWSDWLESMQTATGRHVIDGIGGYMNIMPGILTQWGYSRANSVGLGMYRYGFTIGAEDPVAPGLPVLSGSTVVHGDESLFYTTIKSAMFQNPAPVPDMPWKSSPTRGYLFGQVTDALEPNNAIYQNWVYKGTVTAAGPAGANSATYQTETDATGAYGFIDLPPGSYAISVSASGYTPIQDYPADVTAGIATRTDFALAPVINAGDYKSVADALDSGVVAENQLIGLSGKVATVASGAFPNCVFVEEADRSCGIQVRFGSATPTVVEGDRVVFIGLINAINGERMLTHAAMQSKTPGTALGALHSSVKDLSRGVSSTSLLVHCAGKVVSNGAGWFTVNDGSGVVKVLCAGLVGPAKDASVKVTGISGYDTERIVRARNQADIIILSGSSVTAPSGTIGTGFGLVSLPYVPVDSAPSAVFGAANLTNSLFSWDNVTQTFTAYDAASPNSFGKLSPTEGYALLTTAPLNLTYQGIPISVDARISIPKSGWALIAQPFVTPALWNHVKVTDGKQTLDLQAAITAGWISRIAFTWDTQAGDWGYVGTGARGSRFDDSLRPWRAYWIMTYRDNLAVIIPAAG